MDHFIAMVNNSPIMANFSFTSAVETIENHMLSIGREITIAQATELTENDVLQRDDDFMEVAKCNCLCPWDHDFGIGKR